jgi:hypothetical protein
VQVQIQLLTLRNFQRKKTWRKELNISLSVKVKIRKLSVCLMRLKPRVAGCFYRTAIWLYLGCQSSKL